MLAVRGRDQLQLEVVDIVLDSHNHNQSGQWQRVLQEELLEEVMVLTRCVFLPFSFQPKTNRFQLVPSAASATVGDVQQWPV